MFDPMNRSHLLYFSRKLENQVERQNRHVCVYACAFPSTFECVCVSVLLSVMAFAIVCVGLFFAYLKKCSDVHASQSTVSTRW